MTLETAVVSSPDITKAGAGTLILDGAGIVEGTLFVSDGLVQAATHDALVSANVFVDAAATLDVTPLVGGITVRAGQTIGGAGTVLGSVTFGAGSTLSPGLLSAGSNARVLSSEGLVSSGDQADSLRLLVVPEPAFLELFIAGMGLLGLRGLRRKR